MNTANPTALLRSLIVYAICVPLAITVGYLLTNPQDYESLGFIGVLIAILIFPILMKWHYPLLVFSWGLPVSLFFLPGHPTFFAFMVLASLMISVVERILNRHQQFLPARAVKWPLLAFLVVVIITAKLTGGFGLRSMGSEVYGGKKYVALVVGIFSFFAITARPIPKKHANLYVFLYFAGTFVAMIQDFYPIVPSPLRFIYLIFPGSSAGMDGMGNQQVVLGVTRLAGIPAAASAFFAWMLARYGFRECFLTPKLWRPAVLGFMVVLVFLGGYRSAILSLMLVTAFVFYFEKMHKTGVVLVVLLLGITGATVLVPLAPNLPYTFQRSLAFLPLNISPQARMDAESTSQWRLDMWEALLPQIPKYLLLGKGYAFSAQTYDESMGATATFQKNVDAAENPLALSSDFHNGPLSVLLSFGIWGVVVWLWFWAAGFWLLWHNYHYGDLGLQRVNTFLFASFVAKCTMFLFIFGAVTDDMAVFSGIFGLSIALNHGVMRPRPLAAKNPVAASPQLAYPGRPAFQR